ncbi:hypothetical protein GYMLUDRAFT_61541 [Collybiopsis luxurians FD-317 M1]|uniref:HAT C-terminal dimerisation domain-containing protein n=1 Tax=Collybiopsis luxurians FD-317 M1 TaxID=944289 RepID=A0A0D0CGE4_9AGAR|nr:hypothetical protein GYMLUDRAFT_61541 [Collybiopsis luxurians FD-317 M1]
MIAEDVKKLYTKMKEKLAAELQAYKGELPIALDCWTSPNHHTFMSISVSWLHNNENGEQLMTMLLDFLELPRSHSTENMAQAAVQTLREYGIEKKVSALPVHTKFELTYLRLS